MRAHGAKRALTATVTVVILALAAACAGDPETAGPKPGADPTAPGSSGAAVDPAAQVDHTVPAPGPRGPGLLAPADIQVVSPKTIDKDTVEAVQALKGVVSVDVISLSTPVIENEAFTIAAVDPATYRNYTKLDSANFQDAWDRVANGELALKKRLKGKAPMDDQGYLKLGAATDAPAVHVGAFIDQQPLIDAVVNKTWIKTLGMIPDNALLVRTGANAPTGVRDEIEKLLPEGTAASLVDLASRSGVDPTADQIAIPTGTVADAVGVFKYTVLSGGHIAPDPAWVSSHIATEVLPILGSVTCNKLIFPQLKAALQEIHERGLDSAIHPDQYAGCYYPRFIAGTSTLSNHAFGLALDINAVENGRGTAGLIDRGVVQIFKDWGFTWGGDWGYTDPMHFEMNQIVNPELPTAARQ